ncbi:YchO/YchP family invasin [Serratia fonticola]|uniref:YchO/YchP family invasin n=1 Tax=Serratia fonticola TaxID=47917 RepID=UPI001D00D8EF|nr:YchO/YchP family invasin [Serratia fonticola]
MTKVIQQKMSQLLSSTRLLGLLALPVMMFNAQAEAPPAGTGVAGAQAEAPVAAKSEAESTVEAPSIGTSVIDDLAKAPPTATVETQTVVPPAAVAEAQAVAPAAEAQTVAPPAAVAETQAAPPPAEAQTIAPPAVANAADIPAQVPAAVTPIEKPAAVVSEIKAQASPAQELPELGSAGVNDAEKEKEWATRAKKLAEQNLNQISSERARADTKDYLTNQASSVLQQETEELLSPLGTAKLSLAVTPEGDFTGSSGQLFSPLYDVDGLLTYSQVGYLQKANGSQGNFGLGQRWMVGDWLLGYNSVLDTDFQNQRNRGSIGAEAWGDYLRLSANYYHPLSSYSPQANNAVFLGRPARGYDITTQGYLPFYHQLGASLSFEQYRGASVDLLGNGNKQTDPSAMQVGLNYTPVPLVTVKALHKLDNVGETQDKVELAMTYRLGVPLLKQISPYYVEQAKSLRGSRYDSIERNNVPVLEFRESKTLQVFLATPSWSLNPGETLPLVLEIKAANKITAVNWQGDTQAVSLTPPANTNDPQGWTLTVPEWDETPGASNHYQLSVTLEDEKQQKATSNWITLQVTAPLSLSIEGEPGLPPPQTLQPPAIPAVTGPLHPQGN